ncbi:MAG: hypothetical protein GY811_19850 [Myxococcales bacterium]|nr:hypothetical protein [Myxococcales bacterium]
MWFIQLDGTTHVEKSGACLLGIGAHYYIRDALWLRGGLSHATVFRKQDANEKSSEGGLAVVGGAGVDVYRRGIFAIDLEIGVSQSNFKKRSLSIGCRSDCDSGFVVIPWA